MTQAQLDRISAQQQRALTAAIWEAFQQIKDDVVLAEIARRIEAGDLNGAVDALGINRAALAGVEDGIEAARQHGGGAGGMAGEFTLGAGAVLDAQGVQDLERLIGEIKAGIAGARTDYARLERLVIDLKSLEIQLLSPGPRTAVVKALLDAVREGLADMGVRQMAERIGRIVG